MKFTHLFTAMCCAMSLVSCGKEKQIDLFDYSALLICLASFRHTIGISIMKANTRIPSCTPK